MNIKKITNYVVAFTMIIVLSMAVMNCTHDVPTGSTKIGRATGELYAGFYQLCENSIIEHHLDTYSLFERYLSLGGSNEKNI